MAVPSSLNAASSYTLEYDDPFWLPLIPDTKLEGMPRFYGKFWRPLRGLTGIGLMIVTHDAIDFQDIWPDDGRHTGFNPEDYRVLRVTPEFVVLVVHYEAADHDEILTHFVTLQLRHDPSDGRTMLFYGWRHDSRFHSEEPLRDDLSYYLKLLDNPDDRIDTSDPEPPGGWFYFPYVESSCVKSAAGRLRCD